MKKNLFLLVLFILGMAVSSHAQLREGNFVLGTDLGSGLAAPTNSGLLGFNFGLNDGAGYDLGISPKAGFMLTDNFLLGGIVNLGFSNSAESNGESTKTTVYGVQAFTRMYIRPEEARLDELVSTGRFFLETNAGIAGVNVTDGPTTNGFAFGFGPGYSYFLNSNVAIEAGVKYNGLVGGGNTDYQNSLGLNLGILIFFPQSEAREAVEQLD